MKLSTLPLTLLMLGTSSGTDSRYNLYYIESFLRHKGWGGWVAVGCWEEKVNVTPHSQFCNIFLAFVTFGGKSVTKCLFFVTFLRLKTNFFIGVCLLTFVISYVILCL